MEELIDLFTLHQPITESEQKKFKKNQTTTVSISDFSRWNYSP